MFSDLKKRYFLTAELDFLNSSWLSEKIVDWKKRYHCLEKQMYLELASSRKKSVLRPMTCWNDYR